MIEAIILKVFGDICLYNAVIGSFPLLFHHDFLLLIPALLCAAGTGLAAALDRSGRTSLRFLGLLLPLCSLLLADGLIEFLMLLPPIAYTALVIFRGGFELEYYSFRETFLRLLKLLCGFAALIFALGYFEGMFGDFNENYDFTVTGFYGLLYAFTGVFLMRQLRLGADGSREDQLRNNIEMVIVLAAIIILTAVIVAAEQTVQDLITALLNVILVLAGVIPMVIHELISWLLRDNGAYIEAVESARQEVTETAPRVTYQDLQGVLQSQQPEESGYPWWLAVLLLVGMSVLMVYLLRILSRESGSRGRRSNQALLEEDAPRKKEKRRSNRSRVRRIYRDYLKLVRRKGLKLETDQTSQDIMERSSRDLQKAAEGQLRQIYLKARYDLSAQITREDVDQAKLAYHRLTGNGADPKEP